MKMVEEFRIADKTGHQLILQRLTKGLTYLDYGMTHLPHDFEGYRVKYTDRTAEMQEDGSFKVSDSGDTFTRVS